MRKSTTPANRPPSGPVRSFLRQPLDAALGAEGNVRVLRSLVAAHGEPMSPGVLSIRTGLSRSNVHRILDTLEETGIVALIGIGSRKHVQLRGDHPLVPVLTALFTQETRVFSDLLQSLREAAQRVTSATAIWIEGPLSAGTDRLGDVLQCYILAAPDDLQQAVALLRSALTETQRTYHISVPIRGITRAELNERGAEATGALLQATLLAGSPPAAFHAGARSLLAKNRNILVHADHDEMALQLGARIAEIVKRDPSFVARAIDIIERRQEMASTGERQELEEWAHLLRTGTPRTIRNLLVHSGEQMTRLRQTMPFLSALTEYVQEPELTSSGVLRTRRKSPFK